MNCDFLALSQRNNVFPALENAQDKRLSKPYSKNFSLTTVSLWGLMSAKFGGCWEHALNNPLSRVAGWLAIRLIVPPSSGRGTKCFPLALVQRFCFPLVRL